MAKPSTTLEFSVSTEVPSYIIWTAFSWGIIGLVKVADQWKVQSYMC